MSIGFDVEVGVERGIEKGAEKGVGVQGLDQDGFESSSSSPKKPRSGSNIKPVTAAPLSLKISDDWESEGCADAHGSRVLNIDPDSEHFHDSASTTSIAFESRKPAPNLRPVPIIGLSAFSDCEEESSPVEPTLTNAESAKSSCISASLRSESSKECVDGLEYSVELPNIQDVCDGEELSIAVCIEPEPSDFMATLLR
jgi:hypothetical protein